MVPWPAVEESGSYLGTKVLVDGEGWRWERIQPSVLYRTPPRHAIPFQASKTTQTRYNKGLIPALWVAKPANPNPPVVSSNLICGHLLSAICLMHLCLQSAECQGLKFHKDCLKGGDDSSWSWTRDNKFQAH